MRACLTRTSCCGIAALLLFSGVACFAFVCSRFWVLKSRTRHYPDKHGIGFDAEEREDRISQLSDDILILIISRLPTSDAVGTSVLSRRWRHVYTFITDVRFLCSRMPMPYDSSCRYYHEGEKLSQLPRKFVRAVDTFLQNHSGSKIISFELLCCFRGHILDNFRKWMNSVGNLGVEQLTVGYCCPLHMLESKSHVFSSDFLPEASSVKRLCLKGGFFQTPNQNSLIDLELNDVSFTSEAIECILSNCSSLQSLKLKSCTLPSKLCISSPDLKLKSLTVSRCLKVTEIDLSAINLVTFEFCNVRMVMLSLSSVPLLQNLFIEICGGDATHVFEKVAEDLPHLKCMFFRNTARVFERFEIGEVYNLSNLRQLALFLNYYNKLDLLALATVLDACPLLHKFHLSMKQSSTFNGKQLAEKRVVSCHTQLKEVEFSGFNETEDEYNFILFILKSIVSLQRLSIFVHFRSYDVGLGRWLDTYSNPRDDEEKQRTIRTWLQGQVISKNVEIAIV